MKRPDTEQKSEGNKNKPRSFSETARELLEWQRGKFAGEVFENSNAEGKDKIRKIFVAQKNSEDGPDRMIRILDFLTSKMKIDDGGQLRAMLNELKGEGLVSILPTENRVKPAEILRKLLTGEFDETLEVSEIARRGQAYTLALYLYMHTSGDSEEEMTKVLIRLIKKYDDPRMSRYDYDIKGLEMEPSLAGLCAIAIEKHGLGEAIRKKFKYALGTKNSEHDDIDDRNARLVLSPDNGIQSSL